ncbi:hypothetical protein ABIB48_000627 [Arthrobacter sp. UYCu511]
MSSTPDFSAVPVLTEAKQALNGLPRPSHDGFAHEGWPDHCQT